MRPTIKKDKEKEKTYTGNIIAWPPGIYYSIETMLTYIVTQSHEVIKLDAYGVSVFISKCSTARYYKQIQAGPVIVSTLEIERNKNVD